MSQGAAVSELEAKFYKTAKKKEKRKTYLKWINLATQKVVPSEDGDMGYIMHGCTQQSRISRGC